LSIDKIALGETHEDVLSTYMDIAKVYEKTEKTKLALIYYKKVLEIREKLFGENDMDTISLRDQIEDLEQTLR
jgi:hypothetical protein